VTLQQIIARYESARAQEQAQPINARTSGLTPLGHAVWAATRLADALAPLSAEERASVLRYLPGVAELAPITA
jgi:hypothetical protein